MSRATSLPSNLASTTLPGSPAASARAQPAARLVQGKRASPPAATHRRAVRREPQEGFGPGKIFIICLESFLPNLNRVEQAVETVQRRVLAQARVQHLTQEIDGVRNGAHALGQGGAAGIGMAAALKFLGHLQRLPVAAAKAGDDHAIGAAEQRE